MKKYIGIALAVLMVIAFSGMAMAQGLSDNQTFNFNCTVEKYIEVNTAYKVVELGGPIPGHAVNPSYDGGVWTKTIEDAIYANCPFRLSFSGDNNECIGKPILDREEVDALGTGIGHYDRLYTYLIWEYYVNDAIQGKRETEGGPEHVHFWGEPGGGSDWDNGWDNDMDIWTPHNGEVALKVELKAGLPHTSPDFGNSNTWDQSADAGEYSAHVTFTYTALP